MPPSEMNKAIMMAVFQLEENINNFDIPALIPYISTPDLKSDDYLEETYIMTPSPTTITMKGIHKRTDNGYCLCS